jgi:hypothetical protein
MFLPVREQHSVVHSVSVALLAVPSTSLTAYALGQNLVVELPPLVLHQFRSTELGLLLARNDNIKKER